MSSRDNVESISLQGSPLEVNSLLWYLVSRTLISLIFAPFFWNLPYFWFTLPIPLSDACVCLLPFQYWLIFGCPVGVPYHLFTYLALGWKFLSHCWERWYRDIKVQLISSTGLTNRVENHPCPIHRSSFLLICCQCLSWVQ